MDLLPKSHTEFSTTEYWDQFFKKRGSEAFEWYGEYPQLCGILHKYMKPADKILVIGCGNSQLSADLYDVGYHSIMNIDISDVAIRQMTEKNSKDRPEMSFIKMDMLQMSFEDGSFSAVFDKGTLDALMTDDSEEIIQKVEKMFSEIGRVLKIGGRYICITLCQQQILKKALDYFSSEGWMVRVHRVQMEADGLKEFPLPVFAFIFTKFKKMPNFKSILEVCPFEDKTDRMESVDKVTSAVQEMQQYAIIRNKINRSKLTEEQMLLELYSASSPSPRYSMHIVDGSKQRKPERKFAVFIVPEGRETEWLFSSNEGRKQVYGSAAFERLVITTLHRDHSYESLDAIKAELSSKVMELSPPGLPENMQVPFLSLGDDIGQRTVRFRGSSDLSGDYIIEDVVGEDQQSVRRLVFLSNQNLIQSETKLIPEKKKGKKKSSKLVIDPSELPLAYQSVVVAGLAFLENFHELIQNDVRVVLVGLGGGRIPSYMHHFYKKVSLDVVEIDPSVVNIATDWFGFLQDERMHVHVEDGLEFISKMADSGQKCHVLIIDVDSKDVSKGTSCPPVGFVDIEFLQKAEKCLHPEGVFILNLVSRDKTLRDQVIGTMQNVFKSLYIQSMDEDLNEIMFALPHSRSSDLELSKDGRLPKDLTSALTVLNDVIKIQRHSKEAINDLKKALDGLKLL